MQLPYRKPGKFSQTKLDPFVTEAKIVELNTKLEKLKKAHPHAASEVSRLAELGDFSENAEYQLAKGKLRGINNHILELENQLKQAVVIIPQKNTDTVGLGDTVVVEINGIQKTYQILGSSETNPGNGIISHHSPIGEALVGRKVGETIMVKIGNKEIEYKIIALK